MRYIFLLLTAICAISCSGPQAADDEKQLSVKEAAEAPIIDGLDHDACWQQAQWHLIDKLWLGKLPHATDFMGKFKLSWDSRYLYVLAEIYDDTLVDTHPDGLDRYWDDDCLEVFVDEDASGGDHQYNYNAFAYHISLNGNLVDIGPDSLPHYYNDHGKVKITRQGKISTWEIALQLYPSSYSDSSATQPVTLQKGKTIGFAIAYNDNDKSAERENMLGNIDIKPNPDKNRGWIDASVFGKITLQ